MSTEALTAKAWNIEVKPGLGEREGPVTSFFRLVRKVNPWKSHVKLQVHEASKFLHPEQLH